MVNETHSVKVRRSLDYIILDTTLSILYLPLAPKAYFYVRSYLLMCYSRTNAQRSTISSRYAVGLGGHSLTALCRTH